MGVLRVCILSYLTAEVGSKLTRIGIGSAVFSVAFSVFVWIIFLETASSKRGYNPAGQFSRSFLLVPAVKTLLLVSHLMFSVSVLTWFHTLHILSCNLALVFGFTSMPFPLLMVTTVTVRIDWICECEIYLFTPATDNTNLSSCITCYSYRPKWNVVDINTGHVFTFVCVLMCMSMCMLVCRL